MSWSRLPTTLTGAYLTWSRCATSLRHFSGAAWILSAVEALKRAETTSVARRSCLRLRSSMPRDSEYLLDILDAARLAMTYVAEKTKEEFEADIQCQDAVIRRLEIIGEAARRISDQTRSALPHLPWNAMIGMRSVMIHEYNDVDLGIVDRKSTRLNSSHC